MKRIILFMVCITMIFSSVGLQTSVYADVADVSLTEDGKVYTNAEIIKEIALAYDRQGGQILYDQLNSRRSIYSSPEDATAQRTYFLDCSSFVNSCYREAFGVNVMSYEIGWGTSPNTGYFDTYAKDNQNSDDVVGYWETVNYTTDASRKELSDYIKSNLQIGDVLTYRHGKTKGSSGHTYIYIGDDNFIHCAGAGSYVVNTSNPALSYDSDASEVTNGRITTNTFSDIFENKSHHRYIFKTTESDTVWSFGIIRPFARGLTPTKEMLDRMEISGLSMEKTASLCENTAVNTGDIITYTITIENFNTYSVPNVTISDIIPQGTEFVSGDSGVTLTGNSLFWQGNVPASETVKVNYSVKVTADIPGTLITSNNTYVSGVKLGSITHSVSGYSKTQQALIGDAAVRFTNEVHPFANTLEMVKKAYKTALNVDLFDYDTPEKVLDQLIDVENYVTYKTTTLSKMIAPNLYGGLDIKYGWTYFETENEKTRLPKEEHLAVGDIILAEFDGGNNVYLYIGNKRLVTVENGRCKILSIGDDIYKAGDNILISLLGYDRYAILRPSMTTDVPEFDIEAIEVTSMPFKTQYNSGDYFEADGMVVTATLSNGETVKISDYTVSPEVLYYPQEKVTVSFENLSTSIDVDVLEDGVQIEKAEVQANLIDGRYVQYNKSFDIAVKSDDVLSASMFENAVFLTDSDGNVINTTKTYADNVLKITPISNLVIGKKYKLTLTDSFYVTFNAATVFELEARDVRSNGVIFNDTFDNLEIAQNVIQASGWVLGESTAGGSIDIVDISGNGSNKALVVNVTNTTSTKNGAQTNLTKKYGGGIKYSNDKEIIIKTRIKNCAESDLNNRAFLMLNRPDSLNLAVDENGTNTLGHEHYTLFCARKTGLVSPDSISGNGIWLGKKLFSDNVLNSWLDIEMRIINGETMKIKAVKEVENGENAVSEEFTVSLTQPKLVYENQYGEGTDVKKFDALERLTFIFRQSGSQKLYIDYITVYEPSDVRANLVSGRYVKFNESIDVSLTSEVVPAIEVLEKTITLTDSNGNEIEKVLNYDNDILKITPVNKLTVGEKYKLVLSDCDEISYSGTKTFELEARDVRSNGTIFSDTFDDLEISQNVSAASGWVLGESNVGGSIDIVDISGNGSNKALVVNVANSTSTQNGAQTNLTKKIGGGIEYRKDRDIVIKTRVRSNTTGTANNRTFFMLNRPDSLNLPIDVNGTSTLGHSHYTLFCSMKSSLTAPDSISGYGIWLGKKLFSENALNSWINVEMRIINGETLKIKAVKEGENGANSASEEFTVPLTQPALVYENQYGEGTKVKKFDALERLTFIFRQSENLKLYIDYVEVYEQLPLGKTAEITFKDGEKIIDTITSSGNIIPSITVQSEGKDATEYYVAVAKYVDGIPNGQIQFKTVTVSGVQTIPFDAIEVDKDVKGLSVKGFVWKKNMSPVCNVAEIKTVVE